MFILLRFFLFSTLISLIPNVFCMQKETNKNKKLKLVTTSLDPINRQIDKIKALNQELYHDDSIENVELIYKKLNNVAKTILKSFTEEDGQKIAPYLQALYNKVKIILRKEKDEIDIALTKEAQANIKSRLDINPSMAPKPIEREIITIERFLIDKYSDYLYSIKAELEHFIDLAEFAESSDFKNFKEAMEKNASDNVLDGNFNLDNLDMFKPIEIKELFKLLDEKTKAFFDKASNIKFKKDYPHIEQIKKDLTKIHDIMNEILDLVIKAKRKIPAMQKVKFILNLD